MLTALRAGIGQGKIVPVLCATATREIGSVALLDLIVHEFPSPADRAEVPGTDLKAKQAGTRRPIRTPRPSRSCSKTLSDPTSQALALPRLYGHGEGRHQPHQCDARGKERMGHISWMQGKNVKAVETLGPARSGGGESSRRRSPARRCATRPISSSCHASSSPSPRSPSRSSRRPAATRTRFDRARADR